MREDLTGRRYGRLTVCREIKQAAKSRRHYWLCRCDCGKEKTVEESHLKTGHTKSCGCYRKELPSSRRIDLTGRQFGRLKVLEEADNSNRTGEYWKCVCSCGRLIEASKESLCAGKTKSCGCLQAETRKKKHEKSDSFCRRNLPGTNRQPEKYGKQYKWLQRRLPAGEFPVAGSDRLSGKSVQSWNLRKP